MSASGPSMRIIVLLAAYNEERYIAACLDHYVSHGVVAYLIDNGSTDGTAEIAKSYLGRGLLAVEEMPRRGVFELQRILERKEQLAAELDADWFMHADCDEIRLPPHSCVTLAQAFAEVESQGYNAVNFMEFTFVPTVENPCHEHARFQETMLWYYPYLRKDPQRLNAWKRQPGRVELAWSAGHRVRFPGLRMYPERFPMRHYLYLSQSHALEKYGRRRHDPRALALGWHGWRDRLPSEVALLPSQAELRPYFGDDWLDPVHPRSQHFVEEAFRMRLPARLWRKGELWLGRLRWRLRRCLDRLISEAP